MAAKTPNNNGIFSMQTKQRRAIPSIQTLFPPDENDEGGSTTTTTDGGAITKSPKPSPIEKVC